MSRSRLLLPAHPVACYVTDRALLGDEKFLKLVKEVLQAGVDIIQVREKFTPTDELLRISDRLLRIPRAKNQKIILNDRLDIALAEEFDGVHLGGTSFPAAEVRRCVPRSFIIGASTHHLQEAVSAEQDGVDYIIFGPIFPTPSKLKYGPPQGVSRLRELAAAVSVPVFAIGGITLENFQECIDAGASGIAAITLFQSSHSLRQVVSQLHHPSR